MAEGGLEIGFISTSLLQNVLQAGHVTLRGHAEEEVYLILRSRGAVGTEPLNTGVADDGRGSCGGGVVVEGQGLGEELVFRTHIFHGCLKGSQKVPGT